MEIVLLLVGVVLGAVPSWFFSRHYYRRAAVDAAEGLIAQRLDSCTDGERTFLVALATAEQPIPRYALINVDYETIGGKTGKWGSNTSIMARSLRARAPHSLRIYFSSDASEDLHMISLSERGKENAEFLLRREYKYAKFSSVDSSEEVRRGLFRSEHNREPNRGAEPGGTITVG